MEIKLIKCIHVLFYLGFVLFACVFLYHVFVFPCNVTGHYYGTLVMAIVLYILQEMTVIDPDKKKQEEKEVRGLSIILGVILLSFVILIFASCSHKGYGCTGRSKTMTGDGYYKKYTRKSY